MGCFKIDGSSAEWRGEQRVLERAEGDTQNIFVEEDVGNLVMRDLKVARWTKQEGTGNKEYFIESNEVI